MKRISLSRRALAASMHHWMIWRFGALLLAKAAVSSLMAGGESGSMSGAMLAKGKPVETRDRMASHGLGQVDPT